MSELQTDPSVLEAAAKFAAQVERVRSGVDNQTIIPNQYDGLPSGMVAELSADPVHLNPAIDQELAKRRETIIGASQRQEQARIALNTTELTDKYAKLPDEQKQKFVVTQQKAAQIVVGEITGNLKIPGLTADEQWTLDKAREVYEQQKEQNPDAPLTISFSSQTDQNVYSNLVNRLTFPLLIEQSHLDDQTRVKEIKKRLGLPAQSVDTGDLNLAEERTDENALLDGAKAADVAEQPDQKSELKEPIGDQRAKEMAHKLLDELKGNGLIKQYDALNNLIDKADNKVKIAYNLLSFSYDSLRKAKYEDTQDTLKNSFDASQYAANDKALPSKEENGWLYRGIFPSRSEGTKTESRGSLNVDLSQDMLREIDSLIVSGKLKANYKFGAPGGPDSSARHDSISIYFLEKPSDEALSKLAIIAEKNARGDDLVGKKIGRGFAMSEIGSISDQQAEKFVQDLNAIDPELANAVNQHITKAVDGSNKLRTALSEGMFYAIKSSLDCYGLDIQYDANNGINITKR